MTAPRERISFRFSANGRHAACLVTAADGRLVPAWWAFDDDNDATRYRELATDESTRTQPMPTDDGRLLLLRTGAGRHELVSIDPTNPDAPVRTPVRAMGLRLVATSRPGDLALAVELDPLDRTTLWFVRDTPLRLDPAVTLPGRLGGVCWLDPSGRRFAADLRHDGRIDQVVVDLDTGTWRTLPAAVDGPARLLLSDPRSGLLLLAAETDGRRRIGIADGDDVRFPLRLNRIDGAVLPLGFDPAGGRVALRVTRGAGADLVIYDVAGDRLRPTSLPTGSIHPVAGWGDGVVRVPYSHPGYPTDIVTVPINWRRPAHTAVPRVRDTTARTEWFDTPDGGFEAVCLGDWRTSDAVVVALHGGPESAWQWRFDPTLHAMTLAGLAVVAPNQRGSTGYGAAHAAAIHDRWGGPDLADVRHLAETLTAQRKPGTRRPALHGVSYGAFLALLAAAADPLAWSRCAVVAPFLSVARLYADANLPTRALIDRLSRPGHGPATGDATADDLGPRDLWDLAGRIRAPLLIVHGDRDRTVPVTQSRRLRERLLDAGRREHVDFAYVEVPGAGHDPLLGPAGPALTERLARFLAAPAGANPELTAHAAV